MKEEYLKRISGLLECLGEDELKKLYTIALMLKQVKKTKGGQG